MVFHAEQAAAGGVISGAAGGLAAMDNVMFVGPMGMMHGGAVKGVPYSATANTERVQHLSDGNRIRHSSSTRTYRDAEGRTRRDQPMPAVGPFTVAGLPGENEPLMSFISDPVAKASYILNHQEKTAHKMPAPQWIQGDDAGAGVTPALPVMPHLPPISGEGAGPGSGIAGGVRVFARRIERAPGNPGALPASPKDLRREDLGKKLIEGVEAEGSRATFTIPAGAIGNEQPINVVTEEWRSPVLQVLLSSRTSDPRVGEHTYQLTDISRAEPEAALFQVPGDYRLLEGGPGLFNLAAPAPKQ